MRYAKRMNKSAIKKLFIGIIIFMAGLVLAQFLYDVYCYLEKKANHEKVQAVIQQDLLFSWDTMDAEIEEISEWTTKKNLTNADRGRLYERLSLIYMQKGETMTYYRNLGYALYYLERSEDTDYTINIYLDLANFFLNNYTVNSAQSMIDKAESIKRFDDIEDLQIRSYAFRMLGIMKIQSEDYETAEEFLDKAQELVDMSHTGVYEEAYTAINDVWLAKVYVETGRYDECREKLDKWEGHVMFTTDVYRQIMLRDLIIPFYQAKSLLQAAEIFEGADNFDGDEFSKKEHEVADAIEDFMKLCEENGYEKAELSTILELQKKYPPTDENIRSEMYAIVNRLYTKLFDNQNVAYANVIDNMVEDSKLEMNKAEIMESQVYKRTRLIILSILVVIVVFIILAVIIFNSRFDGLTGLLNRKNFNLSLQRAKRRNDIYGVIMIDIDDFKQINDTYGHQNGDIVLGRLGQLMQREITADVHCYRYGGEEFAIILDKKAIPYTSSVGERLRKVMALQNWEFAPGLVITLSVGVATGTGNDDVLKMADDNLYHSKAAGKNQVTD